MRNDDLKFRKQRDPTLNIERIIFSGHHSAAVDGVKGTIGGEFLPGLDTNEIKLFLNENRALRNVKVLALFGCYTGSSAMMENPQSAWSQTLPQIKFRVGFNGVAPAKTNPVNFSIFSQVLAVQSLVISDLNRTGAIDTAEIVERIKTVKTQGRALGSE